MILLLRQVRLARRRLWLNRWLGLCGVWISACTLTWTLTLVLNRLFVFGAAMSWLAVAGLVASLIGASIHLFLKRDADAQAAVALDQAAGLKDRVASALAMQDHADDAFAAAVVADAEQVVAGLTPRRFLPLRWPRTLSWSAVMVLFAVLSLLLPEFDLLRKKEAHATQQLQQQQLTQVRQAVARPVAVMQKLAQSQQDADLDKQLRALDETLKKEADPETLRRTAAKQLDRLEGMLKEKADADRYKALKETKNRLRNLGRPESPGNELGALMDRLSRGDFEAAQKELRKAREHLAKLMKDPKTNPEQLQKMQKQLEELSRKLQQTAEDKKTERELKNAGLSDKDIQRALEALAKKDSKQLEKLAKELAERLKDKGMTREQMEKLLNKVAQNQEAKRQLEKMAEKLSRCAGQMEKGDREAAQEQMEQAEEQLSELEQMEQALNELEGQLADLQSARDDLNGDGDHPGDQKCAACDGSGFKKNGAPCPVCNGTGRCRGNGRSSSPRDRDDSGEFDFVNKKDRTLPQKGGAIISQEYVKGKQLINRSRAELYDAAQAAEIEATDSLNRERIPPAYRRGVRTYFDRLGDQFKPRDGASFSPSSSETTPKPGVDKP